MEQIANSLEGYVEYGIGMFPKDWKINKVGEVCKIFGRIGFRGYTVKDIVEEGKGAITLSPSNIQDNNLVLAKCTFISWLKYEESPEIKVFNGDILLVKTGSTFGKTAYVNGLNEKATVNPQIIVLKRINTNPRFLAYVFAFKTIQNQITATIVGGAIPTLSQAMVANFELAVPPTKAEQIAIANVLSDADALIQSLTRLIAKKRQIKQGAMQTLLNPYENGRLKAGWVVKKLSEIGEIVTGSTPSTQVKEYWNGEIPWITPTDITNEKNIFESEREISATGLKVTRKLPANTLLVTCIASIGKNAILRKTGACNQQINAIIPDKGMNVDFLYYLMENNKQHLLSNAGITATLILSKKEFSEMPFAIPLLDEQTRIAKILSDMDAEIAALETKLAKYRHIKQGMMQNLLTGRIRLI